MNSHIVPIKVYISVVVGLLLLTLLTTEIARFDLGPFNALAAMLIAAAKTSLVVLFFMHMKWSSYQTRVVAASGLLWLAVLVLMTWSDYRTRNLLVGPGPWPIAPIAAQDSPRHPFTESTP